MLSILRILFGTNRGDEKSEIRERAGSRQLVTTLQKHDSCSPASRHRFPKLVIDSNADDKMRSKQGVLLEISLILWAHPGRMRNRLGTLLEIS